MFFLEAAFAVAKPLCWKPEGKKSMKVKARRLSFVIFTFRAANIIRSNATFCYLK